MTRRQVPPLFGKRHCGNTAKKEVHDLDKETVQCQIDAILESRHALPFISLKKAHQLGYDNCGYCIGGGLVCSEASITRFDT